MRRLVEQPTEDGPVCVGRVHYHLSVYQHFSNSEDESVRRISMWRATSPRSAVSDEPDTEGLLRQALLAEVKPRGFVAR